MKILLDTDIGSDIDDCLALAYLLAAEEVELLGITTVAGRPHLRAQLAHAVCEAAGRRIPVAVGCAEPLSGTLRETDLTAAQRAVAEGCSVAYPEGESAIELMRRTIEAHPHEVTLLAIGPLTNVATLFARYPHIPALLCGLALMGGRYTDDPAFDTARWGRIEWNILCDVAAATAVLGESGVPILAVGVEQTCRFSLPPRPLKEVLWQDPARRPVSASITAAVDRIYFHDAVLAYALLAPEEVGLRRGRITVDAEGRTVFTPAADGSVRIVTDYDPERFLAHYLNTLGISLPPLRA